jgi:HAD superfamily hydrolase (TIGR01509 family)
MQAILFGSIGTIAETSELQRRSFNEAFKAHGLDWHWPRAHYQGLLVHSGGQQRIEAHAGNQTAGNQQIDAKAIHETKSQIFQTLLTTSDLMTRAGVLETIQTAKMRGVRLGLVSATSPENVTQLLAALSGSIQPEDFAVIVDRSRIARPKPAPDAYSFALERLGISAQDCIAIEDNHDGLLAALAAGLECVAFPGENTADHDFSKARRVVDHIDVAGLIALIPSSRLIMA